MYSPRGSEKLGDFVRARRAQLQPEDVGMPVGRRRRVAGLRREEAAQLCGISPTWLTWIEQGRTKSVSVPTLASIARGFRLSRAERRYLFELAGQADPERQPHPDADREALQRLVDALSTPAYVLDRLWDAVAWNRAAREIFSPWLPRTTDGTDSTRYNLLDFVFLNPAARRLIVDWRSRAERLVAEYRADTAAWQDEPVLLRDVEARSRASVEFAAAWQSHHVLGRDGGRRGFQCAKRGRREFEQSTFRVALRPDLKLIILAPLESVRLAKRT